MKNALLTDPKYDPNFMIDVVIEHLNLKNDAALSRLLEFAPPIISKLRHRKIPIGPIHLISIHDASGISIRGMKVAS